MRENQKAAAQNAQSINNALNKIYDLYLGNENKEQVCPICGKTFVGYGNNPRPVTNEGRCCDECNSNAVIPARILCMSKGVRW